MKWFTHPQGKFVIRIPIEWQYKNIESGIEAKSPFCFGRYEEWEGSFQISCYGLDELKQNPNVPIQKAGTNNLKFVRDAMGDDKFRTRLWFASVGDHTFIIKYVYSVKDENSDQLNQELILVEEALASLQLLALNKRSLAIEIDIYEKFIAALSASFDIKNKALENEAIIEFMVIAANQIDAYLRMALVLRKQILDQTDRIDTLLLFQGESDAPVMEREIYRQAFKQAIIDQQLFDDLDRMYKERNKVIHRYIITDFKTRTLYKIALDYEQLSERVRQALRAVEDEQAKAKIGIYKGGLKDAENVTDEDRRFLYAQVNDKHLLKDLARRIAPKKA